MKKIFLLFIFFSLAEFAYCGQRYFISGGVDNNWGTTGNWSLTSGGGGGQAVPTASDTVHLDANSPNCTVNASARVARILDFTGYTNTITMTYGITVSGNITLGASMGIAGASGLTVNTTATLTSNGITWPNGLTLAGTSQTYTLGDNWTVSGTLTLSGTTAITLNGAFNMNVGGSLTVSTSTSGTTTIVMNGTGTWSGAGTLKNNLTFNTAGTITVSGTVYFNSKTLTYTAGTMSVGTSILSTVTHSNTTTTFNTSGMTWANMNHAGATFTLTSDINISGTLTLGSTIFSTTMNGAYHVNVGGIGNAPGAGGGVTLGTAAIVFNGTGAWNANTQLRNNVTFNSAGTITITTGVFNSATLTYTAGTMSVGSSTLYLQGGTSTTTLNTNGMTWANVSIGSNNALTISLSSNMNVGGTLSTAGSNAITINTGAINANGNITLNNSYAGGGGTGTININGTGDQTFTGSGVAGSGRLPNVTINKSSGTLSLASIISVAGDWTYTAGTVDQGSSTLALVGTRNFNPGTTLNKLYIYTGTTTLTGNVVVTGDVKIYSGATLVQNSKTITIGGNWDNSGTYTTSNAMVTFNATYDQYITKSSGVESFNRLCMNKPGGHLNLSSPVQINDSLKLMKGQLVSTSTNYVKIVDDAKATGGADTAYVSGYMKKIGDDAFTFPMGKGVYNYHPVSITAPSSTSDDFSAEYYNAGQTYGSGTDGTLTNLSDCEYWVLNRNAGTSNVSATYGWYNTTCNVIPEMNNMLVAHWNGSQWVNLHNGGTTGNNTVGTVTTGSAVTAYGAFALAQCGIATPTISAAPNATICSGTTVTLTASGGGTYSWSTGSTATAINITPSSTAAYSVTATNAYGCTAMGTKTITVNPMPSPTVTVSPSLTICSGQNVSLIASGGDTYSWSTGSTSDTLSVTPTTTSSYTVQVGNSSGCIVAVTNTVIVNSTASASIASITPVDCPGDNTGEMTVSASGGTTPYTYLWDSSPEQTTATATGLYNRIYMATVTGANGCTAYAIDTIQTPVLPANDSLQEWVRSYYDTLVGLAASIVVHDSIYVCGTTWTDTSGNDFLVIKYSPSGDVMWSQTYNGTYNGSDEASAIAVDTNGNVYVTGSSEGKIPGTSSPSGKDYVTIKYDKDGNKKWTARYNGNANTTDSTAAIGIFNDTSIVVTGFITQTTTGRNFGTIAYGSTAGNQLWVTTYTGTATGSVDEASSLTTDEDGYIYVNGRSTGDNGRDLMTMKYENDGDIVWERRYADYLGGNRLYERDPIALDKNGNVYAAGTLGATTDCALIKYNASGTFQWVQTYDGAGSTTDQVLAIAVDTNTNIFLTGYAGGDGTGNDYATLAYASNGDALWLQLYDGSAGGNDIATAIALDDSGRVYVTGASATHCTNLDFVTIKYLGDDDGDLVWTQHYNSFNSDTDMASAVAVDEGGDVYVTGKSKTAESGFDATTVKYDQQIFSNIADINDGMQTIAMGMLRASKSTTIKNIFYSYLDTAMIDSAHVYYYISLDDLIKWANGSSYFLKDTMNATLNAIYSTSGTDYVTRILNGLPYREGKLKPYFFIPHLDEFDSGERAQNPYLGHGFLEEDYPLNGYSGISGNTPTEKTLAIEDVFDKPTWLVFPSFPNPPIVGPIVGVKNILLSECIMKNFNCNACSSGFPNAGIPNTNFNSTTECGSGYMNYEYKIRIGADGCQNAVKWDDAGTSVENFGLLSSIPGFVYWSSVYVKIGHEIGLRFTKKVHHPIRKYEYAPQANGHFKDGDILTLCNNCNTFNEWISSYDRTGLTGMLAKNGLYKFVRNGQKDVYFTLPLSLGIWYRYSPDGAMYFGTSQISPPATCPDAKISIEEDYLYSNYGEYLNENIFSYGTDYLASTDRTFIENYWKDDVITVGFMRKDAQKIVNNSDELFTFTAPSTNTAQLHGTLIQELTFNYPEDVSEYMVGRSLQVTSFPLGIPFNRQIVVHVTAKFNDGSNKVIDEWRSITLGATSSVNFYSVVVDIRGQIKDYNYSSTNYLVQIFDHF